MNEKDIRDRIGQFLKRTARTVVVPASMGLGLSSTACHGNSLKPAGDAGLDSGKEADVMTASPDLAADTIEFDVPMIMPPYLAPPYLVPRFPDAAVDTSPISDADNDVLPDVRSDIPFPPPPYLAPMPPDAAADGTREASRADADSAARPDVRAEVRFPEPPYLLPAIVDDPLLGPAAPRPKK